MKKLNIGMAGIGFIADWHYQGFKKNTFENFSSENFNCVMPFEIQKNTGRLLYVPEVIFDSTGIGVPDFVINDILQISFSPDSICSKIILRYFS